MHQPLTRAISNVAGVELYQSVIFVERFSYVRPTIRSTKSFRDASFNFVDQAATQLIAERCSQCIMKNRFLLSLTCLLFFWQCGQKGSVSSENLIIEGEGVGPFRVNRTKLDDVISTFGPNYETVSHEDSRLEASYKGKGLSFYYQSDDSSKTIYAIILRQPFSGKTQQEIGLESTMEEVSDAYGQTEWYTPCKDCDTWIARYNGIEFEIERDKSLPKFPLDYDVHLKKNISKIFVYRTQL